ncbi:MAG: hypothetical protein JWN52_321 [Actinomycetia bacterium]|nr:hypothetical protein [Actinomycetes bacterium]
MPEMSVVSESGQVTERRLAALRAAANAFAKVGNLALEARTRLELASQLLMLEQGDAGLDDFRRVVELFRATDPHQAGHALLGCAHALDVQGRHEQSLAAFEEAIGVFEQCRDAAGEVEATAGLLETLMQLKRWTATDRAEWVLERTGSGGVQILQVSRLVALRYKALAVLARSDYAAAIGVATEGANMARELGELEDVAAFWLMVGRSLHQTKQYEQAISTYERIIALTRGKTVMAELEAQALEGLGTVLRDAPRVGEARFRELAQRYATEGNARMEALCRYQRAQLLERVRDADRRDYVSEYVKAARLFDECDALEEAGQSWYRAALAYNLLGLLEPEYREQCYSTCEVAADRFEAVDDQWGKGCAEYLAGQALRKDDPSSPLDPRSVPMLRRSVQSFARAGRPVESAVSMLTVALQLSTVSELPVWAPIAIAGLRSYDLARPSLQMPYDRRRNDEHVAYALRILTSGAQQTAAAMSDSPTWVELVWLLGQTAKARTFMEQRLQDELWSSLAASDQVLRSQVKRVEDMTRIRDELSRKINRALFIQQIDAKVRKQADRRQEVEQDLKEAERQVNARLRELARAQPVQLELAGVALVSPEELAACLHPGEAYLDYLWNDGAPLRTLITPTTFSITVADGISATYTRQLTEAARRGESLTDTDPQGAVRLLGPLPPEIDTLIIAPDALLVGVPWHLIPLPGAIEPDLTLGDRYTVAVVPAAGMLHQLRTEERRSTGPEAAYLGVACDGGGDDPLRCPDDEVATIAHDYFADAPSSNCLVTSECHRFLEVGCSVRLLHLSCHAERHGLLLSTDGTWTTPVDLLNLPGRTFKADLILLTGCYAGDFSERENNEFLGIVRQLMVVTQARAAVISVAPVPDAAAPVFADLIISALTGHNPGRPRKAPAKPQAVGAACSWARQTLRTLDETQVEPLVADPTACLEPESPRWWSPWFVLGDPRAVLEASAATGYLRRAVSE